MQAPLDLLADYWCQPAEVLLDGLHSSPEGLGAADARQRLERHGPNVLTARRKATTFGLLANQFKSPIILILLFATGVSMVLSDWVDAVIILAIVLGSAALSFVQEFRVSAAAEKLRARLTLRTTVLRDGRPRSLPAEEVVPGDVVLLSAGMRADSIDGLGHPTIAPRDTSATSRSAYSAGTVRGQGQRQVRSGPHWLFFRVVGQGPRRLFSAVAQSGGRVTARLVMELPL